MPTTWSSGDIVLIKAPSSSLCYVDIRLASTIRIRKCDLIGGGLSLGAGFEVSENLSHSQCAFYFLFVDWNVSSHLLAQHHALPACCLPAATFPTVMVLELHPFEPVSPKQTLPFVPQSWYFTTAIEKWLILLSGWQENFPLRGGKMSLSSPSTVPMRNQSSAPSKLIQETQYVYCASLQNYGWVVTGGGMRNCKVVTRGGLHPEWMTIFPWLHRWCPLPSISSPYTLAPPHRQVHMKS